MDIAALGMAFRAFAASGALDTAGAGARVSKMGSSWAKMSSGPPIIMQ